MGVDKLEYVDQAVAGCVAPPFSAPQRAQYAVNEEEGSPDLAALQHGAGYYESFCSFRHKSNPKDQHLA